MDELKVELVSSKSSKIFDFHFPEEEKSVKINIYSEDTSCMTLSVQRHQCPIYDKEDSIRFRGYWLTMTKNGSVIIPKERFPKGFLLILVVHETDDDCKTKYGKHFKNTITPNKSLDANNNVQSSRNKVVIVQILDTVKKEFVIMEVFWPFGIPVFLIIISILVLDYTRYEGNESVEEIDEETGRNNIELSTIHNNREEENEENKEQNGMLSVTPPEIQNKPPEVSKSCFGKFFSPPPPSEVVTLNQLMTKTKENLEQNSTLFLLFVLPVAIYYCLPAIQLVSFYLFTSHQSGNLDLCSYNFQCAYPYWYLNDFNHVWSNICYVFVGAFGFVLVHLHKQKYLRKVNYLKFGHGVPPQFGLSNALSFAILIEGLLSACYHICPNRSNFHHDTCFMYVAVTLSALKLYHSRHPDTALGATKAFALLGLVLIADLLGESLEHLWYFLLFSVLHLVTLIILTTQLYYMGRVPIFSKKLFGNAWAILKNKRLGHSDTTPVASRDVYWLISFGFLLNFGIFLGPGLLSFLDETKPVFDFGTYLLTILGGNTIIYLIYYLVMKCVHGECLSGLTWLLLIISTSFWISGGVFFLKIRTSWEESPANSRVKNQDCDTFFYDTHDLWHILSSGGLYTTLMLLEFIDVDLWRIPQNKIPVF